MRRFLNNAFVIAASVVLALVILEFVVRAAGFAPDLPPQSIDMAAQLRGARQFDPVLEDRYQANGHAEIRSPYQEFRVTYNFNELGLRDRPIPPRSTDSARRILVLGNSFVEGWGVEFDDTFVQVAQRALSGGATASNPPVRLINGGIAGFGAAQSSLFARELIGKVEPDAVVFVFVGSMISADQNFLSMAKLDGGGLAQGLDPDAFLKTGNSPEVTPPNWHDTALRTISGHSALVRLFYVRALNRRAQEQIHPGDPKSDLLAAYRAPLAQMAGLYEPTLRHMAGIRDLALAKGIDFAVLRLPMPFELDGAAWDPGRRAYGIASGVVLPSVDRAKFDAFCIAQRLSCASADAALAGAAAKLFFHYDFHLNPEGNRVLGQWFAQYLLDR